MNFILIPLGIVAYLVVGWGTLWALVRFTVNDDGKKFIDPDEEDDHMAALFVFLFWPIVLAIVIVLVVVVCVYVALSWVCHKLGALLARAVS